MTKKEEIIKAARQLFTEYGYKKVSMDEIAKTAKVTKKTIYHYFKDKDDLFQYFVTEELEQMKDSFESIMAQNLSISERISIGVNQMLDFRKKSSLVASIMKEQALTNSEASHFLSQYDDEIIKYLEIKITGEMNQGNIKKCNANLVAFIIYKIFFAIFFEYRQELDRQQVVKEVNAILQDGLITKGGKYEHE